MKATGIVRRIDDLGRVVIPKEIRRTFRLREGDPLEIFISNNEEVIFKKYSPIGDILSYINGYAKTLNRVSTIPVLISDKEQIISCAGIPKKEILQRKLTKNLEDILSYRETIKSTSIKSPTFITQGLEYKLIALVPIIISSDVCGSIMFVTEKNDIQKDNDFLDKLLQTASGFIESQMSD